MICSYGMHADRYNGYLRQLLDRAKEGVLRPINIHLFTGMEEGVRAMQFLQRANNIGKVVIRMGVHPLAMVCDPAPDAKEVMSVAQCSAPYLAQHDPWWTWGSRSGGGGAQGRVGGAHSASARSSG